MATLNVGAMAARLGLDPSEFLDKMKGVQGFNAFVSSEMARQWKKTGRDGQEGLRLIDEALGIHVARPVARIVSETFPSLGKAMGAILPGVAFSALGLAVFEFAEGVSRRMDEAKKKVEEYSEAARKTKTVYAEASASNERDIDRLKAKIAALNGDKNAEVGWKIKEDAAKQVEDLAKQIDALTEAELREAAAGREARGLGTQFFAGAGAGFHKIFTSDATLGMEAMGLKLKTFQQNYADLARGPDPIKALADSAALLKEELRKANLEHDQSIATWTSEQAEAAHPFSRRFPTVSQDMLATQHDYIENLNAIKRLQDQNDERTRLSAQAEAKDAAKARTVEIRNQISAIARLAETSTASAVAAELFAASTGKGTAASIQAAAAAEAEKRILDARAEANSKLNAQGRRISSDAGIQRALAEYSVMERANALREQTAKATAELTGQIDEFNLRLKERIGLLDEEAAGHGKVAAEQAKVLAGLIPLEEKLKALKELRAAQGPGITIPNVMGGPATPVVENPLDAQIGSAEAALGSARSGADAANAKIQTGAFREELKKLREEMQALGSAEVSPWAKIDAEVVKFTADLKLAPERVLQIRQALTGLQDVKIAGEFEKLAEKIREAQAETAALASGSPFARLDAEAQKIAHEWGITLPEGIATLRQGLMELQSIGNIGRAWLSVDSLNSAGAKMADLRQQMEALSRAAAAGKTGDGVALSGQKLAAVRLAMIDIQEEENKIALKTGDVDAGILAWATDLQKVKSAGDLVFQELTEATKGFEDNTIKSFFAILDSQRGGHQKLMADLKKMWSEYFKSLATLGLKNGMDQLLAPVGKAIGGGMKGGTGGDQKSTSALGGLASILLPKSGAGGAASLTSAGTALHSAAASLTAAAAALRAAAAGGGSVGGGASAGGGFFQGAGNADAGETPFYAAGGDATPGSSFISGEAGAEQVDLDRAGGAHITPLGFEKSGGAHVTNNDFRGAVVTDDLMRRSEAAAAFQASEGRMMAAIPSLQREINQRKRT